MDPEWLVKERPILMSGPMVRATLAEESPKTHTRRIVKFTRETRYDADRKVLTFDGEDSDDYLYPCPYGRVGDRLWVRETYSDFSNMIHGKSFVYAADNPTWADGKPLKSDKKFKWTPSIFMLRVASRITIEITNVRVERLQDISEVDAQREGLYLQEFNVDYTIGRTYKKVFEELWCRINGPQSWGANPFVWVIEFKKVKG